MNCLKKPLGLNYFQTKLEVVMKKQQQFSAVTFQLSADVKLISKHKNTRRSK
jgi:hypothetical protein